MTATTSWLTGNEAATFAIPHSAYVPWAKLKAKDEVFARAAWLCSSMPRYSEFNPKWEENTGKLSALPVPP
jgi:hypothetical protein